MHLVSCPYLCNFHPPGVFRGKKLKKIYIKKEGRKEEDMAKRARKEYEEKERVTLKIHFLCTHVWHTVHKKPFFPNPQINDSHFEHIVAREKLT